MKTFQLICLKCGSDDVGIRISFETAATTYECGKCGNSESGDDSDLMAVKTCDCGPMDGCALGTGNLRDNIQMSQVMAGEAAVIANLAKMGF